ncbi:hypothetical protein ACP26L_36230 (plasmid) [Paenibacillus sp. S-38]|uniref:hypothetical protein n=1 Tax=Paenibacillus sp. S-38 TaxID=3416710 RepID=UPI003CF6A387
MLSIGLTCLCLGAMLRTLAIAKLLDTTQTPPGAIERISRIMLAVGSLEIMLYVLWFFYPVGRTIEFIAGGAVICLSIPLLLMELNKSYRYYRDYMDKY